MHGCPPLNLLTLQYIVQYCSYSCMDAHLSIFAVFHAYITVVFYRWMPTSAYFITTYSTICTVLSNKLRMGGTISPWRKSHETFHLESLRFFLLIKSFGPPIHDKFEIFLQGRKSINQYNNIIIQATYCSVNYSCDSWCGQCLSLVKHIFQIVLP